MLYGGWSVVVGWIQCRSVPCHLPSSSCRREVLDSGKVLQFDSVVGSCHDLLLFHKDDTRSRR